MQHDGCCSSRPSFSVAMTDEDCRCFWLKGCHYASFPTSDTVLSPDVPHSSVRRQRMSAAERWSLKMKGWQRKEGRRMKNLWKNKNKLSNVAKKGKSRGWKKAELDAHFSDNSHQVVFNLLFEFKKHVRRLKNILKHFMTLYSNLFFRKSQL